MEESFYLHQFRVYKTQSKFYLVGRDKSRERWKILKIDRFEPSDLNLEEDCATYTELECHDLLSRIDEGNKPTGGLRFVTNGYGIVGFIRFLGPYYLLVITKRRKIGTICGHAIYAISKSELIPLSNSSFNLNLTDSEREKRYKKILSSIDLTKDFFFSYSYNIMRNLQKNSRDGKIGHQFYDSMFVWNEFLTRNVRNLLRNSVWTVALVYGFFKQVDVSVQGKDLKLTLIARRSRHYAGTRYLKRGVNEKGRVANEVETEQILSEDISDQSPQEISSVVQHRGSIPLFWSQENSWLNPKPDIILYRKDKDYEATRRHFENLVKRYGNPIIILNLIKSREKKPRESILRDEFANAIDFINTNLPEEDKLRFLHWDIHKHVQGGSAMVLLYLKRISAYALSLTGIFFSHMKNGDEEKILLQRGILRTNCIDCLDRTNVAQYAYGLAALGRQLQEFGLQNFVEDDLGTPLADELLSLYEMMGDTLAMQYSGSGAHNKILWEKKGQWKASIQSQELLRIIQRYYSNTYADAERQDAINLFLGHFQPQQGKPALWEMGSDQHYNIGTRDNNLADENSKASLKRSLSDSNISREKDLLSADISAHKIPGSLILPSNPYDSTPEVSPCDHPIPCLQNASPMMDRGRFMVREDSLTTSNFLHFDWIPSLKNPNGDSNRSSMINAAPEAPPCIMERGVDSIKVDGYPDDFVRWIDYGGAFHR